MVYKILFAVRNINKAGYNMTSNINKVYREEIFKMGINKLKVGGIHK